MNPPQIHQDPIASAGAGGLSLRVLVETMRRRWGLFLLPCLLVVAGAGAAAMLMPPRYRAEAIITSAPIIPSGEEPAAGRNLEELEARIAAVRSILFRRSILEPVVVDLDLAPHQDGHVRDESLDEIRKRITVRVEGDEDLAVGIESSDPRQAAAAATRLARILTMRGNAQGQERASATAAFLDGQLPAARARMEELAAKLEQYQQKWIDAVPEQLPTTMKLLETSRLRVQELGTSIAQDEARCAALRRQIADLESQGVSTRTASRPGQSRVEELRVQLRQLLRRYTPEHPDVARAKAELEEVEQATREGRGRGGPEYSPLQMRYMDLRAELTTAEGRVANARAEQEHLREQAAAYQQRVEAAPRHQLAMSAMKRDLETAELAYQTLLGRIDDAHISERLARSSGGAPLRIVENPRPPDNPVAPRRMRIVLLGLLGGIALGAALVFVAEQLDSSVKDVHEAETTTSRAVLVAIPSTPPRFRNGSGPGIAMLDDPEGTAAEQYRILAAKLARRDTGTRQLTIMVTSAICGEGKTTTAVNLSYALSRLVQQEVLLIDADFGRPAVSRLIGLPPGDGFYRLIKHPGDDPAKYVREHEGISILEIGGGTNGNRSALASAAAQRLFLELRQRYPYIVVDAPPVLAVAESLILQQMLPACLFVVRAGYTPHDVARRATESLDPRRLAGVVLNDVGGGEAYAYAYPYTFDREPEQKLLAAQVGR